MSSDHTEMGVPSYVQSLVSRRRKGKETAEWRILKNMVNWTDPFCLIDH